MGLILPDVSITVGPLWAQMINTAEGVIDAHDHTPGKGVKITPAGLSISSDLDFLTNDAINLRTSRYINNTPFVPQPTDLAVNYVSNGELFYRDSLGNVVQITNGGFINVGAGSPILIKDNSFTLEYFADITRQAKFDLTGLPVGISTYQLPGSPGQLVSLNSIDTLSNKTFDTTNIIVRNASGVSLGSPGNVFFCTLRGATVGLSSYVLRIPAADSTSVCGAMLSDGAGNLSFQNVKLTTPSISTIGSNLVLSPSTNRYQRITPSTTNLAITLPVGVLGDTWEIQSPKGFISPDLNTMILRASGGGQIDLLIPNGRTIVTCIVAGATTPAGWTVVYASSSWNTFANAANSTGFTPTTTEIWYKRLNDSIQIRGTYTLTAASLVNPYIGLPTIAGVSLTMNSSLLPSTGTYSHIGSVITSTGGDYSLLATPSAFTDRLLIGGNGTTPMIVGAPLGALTTSFSFVSAWIPIAQFGGY